MKKIVAVLTMACIAYFAMAKRWENFINVGARLPGNALKVEAKGFDDASVKYSPIVGLDFGYTGVLDNGFTLKANLDVSNANCDDDDLDGMNLDFYMGFGYAPVHTQNLLVGVYGILGVNYLMSEYSVETPWSKISTTTECIYPVMGVNATAIYTFTKCFSLYGSLTAEYLLNGNVEVETTVNSSTDKDSADLKGKFLLVPAIGFSWKF